MLLNSFKFDCIYILHFKFQAITVHGDATGPRINITAEPWQDGGNQKWMAIEAGTPIS